jgi:predicted  nucleic acid-binding Zn-ribbon protein
VQELHICPECGSALVQTLEWAPVDMRRSRLELGCPECGRRSVGVFYEEELGRFDARLERGRDSLVQTLAELQHDNMEQEIERFSAALRANQVVPEDF